MANLRAIRKRIRSVRSTQKITKAMKMVSAARFRRAQTAVGQAAPYAERIEELLADLAGEATQEVHPLLAQPQEGARLMVVLSSDRGLCGAFNAGLLRKAEGILREDPDLHLLPIGRKAITYFGRRNYQVIRMEKGFWDEFGFPRAAGLVEELGNWFVEGKFARISILYNRFLSVVSHKPTRLELLPISRSPEAQDGNRGYEYEPDRASILKAIVPKAIQVRFFQACLNSQASEYGARMTAMDSATRNASEMIDKLTLRLNRERQAAITTELMDIIGGAEALSG